MVPTMAIALLGEGEIGEQRHLLNPEKAHEGPFREKFYF